MLMWPLGSYIDTWPRLGTRPVHVRAAPAPGLLHSRPQRAIGAPAGFCFGGLCDPCSSSCLSSCICDPSGFYFGGRCAAATRAFSLSLAPSPPTVFRALVLACICSTLAFSLARRALHRQWHNGLHMFDPAILSLSTRAFSLFRDVAAPSPASHPRPVPRPPTHPPRIGGVVIATVFVAPPIRPALGGWLSLPYLSPRPSAPLTPLTHLARPAPPYRYPAGAFLPTIRARQTGPAAASKIRNRLSTARQAPLQRRQLGRAAAPSGRA